MSAIARQRRPSRPTVWRKKRLYLYLIPTFLMLALFNYYPPLSAFYHAFFTWDGYKQSSFVGLANFQQMARDSELLQSIPNMLKLVAVGIFVGLTVPFLVAELIFNLRSNRAGYLYRLLFVAPVIVPTVVIILIWEFIYDPNAGLLNAILGALHLGGNSTDWLGDPHIALYSLMGVGFPWVAGVNVLIYLAGLQQIPESILDAAQLDGATGVRRLWLIDLPLVAAQVKLLLILGIIAGVQGFSLQFVMTQGGPGFSTEVPGYYMYQVAFEQGQFGYGCAIGLALFLVILALTYLNMRYVRSGVDNEVG